MDEVKAKTIKQPKPKVIRCTETCAYVSGGNEGKRCKNRCDKEPGHFLNCKCRNHELQ